MLYKGYTKGVVWLMLKVLRGLQAKSRIGKFNFRKYIYNVYNTVLISST